MLQRRSSRPPRNSPRRRALALLGLLALVGAGGYALRARGGLGPQTPNEAGPSRHGLQRDTAELDGVSMLGRSASVPSTLEYKTELVDASRDEGWGSEVLSSRAGAQLEVLARAMARAGRLERELLSQVAAEGLEVRHGQVGEARTLRLREDLLVRRWPNPPAGSLPGQGLEALELELGALLQPFDEGGELRFKFKLFRIEQQAAGSFTTEALFQAYGLAGGRQHQLNASWLCGWSVAEDTSAPRLTSLAIEGLEQVTGRERRAIFEDCTQAVIGATHGYREHLLWGVPYWNSVFDSSLGTSIFGHNGLCVADFDGDGLEDVYLCQPGGIPNMLLLQRPDGSAEDRAQPAGVDIMDLTRCALAVDLDNDGDQDLALTTSALLLFENDGSGRFRERGRLPLTHGFSISAADPDSDGDLDLYVCRYSTTDQSTPRPYYDANNGEPNVYLRNAGNWSFTDATEAVGLDQNNSRYSFACSWVDYDDDGDADLYVANDFGRNNLYRNDSGQLTDVAAAAGVEDISAGMSVSWGDYDADGALDLYVGNMFSSAGNRIAFQRNFRPTTEGQINAQYQRHARGNTLFASRADGQFEDVSLESGASMGRWSWSSRFADVDNDGLEDLLVANGYLTNEDDDDL